MDKEKIKELEAAYAAANNRTITLLKDLGSHKDFYELQLIQDVTIDLNGYYGYISATGNYTVYGMDNATVSAASKRYLAVAQKEGRVFNVTDELPKTFSGKIQRKKLREESRKAQSGN